MDVIIIGAGVGGLASAIGLAARGARVTLLEQNARVGGKMNVWEKDGFTFDTGPHVLTMLWALEEVFVSAGQRLEDVLDLVRLDTVCRYHFEGGATFDAPADPDEAARAIAEFAPGDAAGFRRFLAYARQVSDATTDPFLRQDFGAQVRGFPTPAQWGQLTDFLALKPWRTLRDVVHAHFADPRLRQVFELYALYSGSHPPARQASSPPSPMSSGGRGRTMCAAGCMRWLKPCAWRRKAWASSSRRKRPCLRSLSSRAARVASLPGAVSAYSPTPWSATPTV